MGEARGEQKGLCSQNQPKSAQIKDNGNTCEKLSRSLGLVVYAAANRVMATLHHSQKPNSSTALHSCTCSPQSVNRGPECIPSSTQPSLPWPLDSCGNLNSSKPHTNWKVQGEQVDKHPWLQSTWWLFDSVQVTCTQKKCCKESGLPCSSIVYHIQQDMRTKAWDQIDISSRDLAGHSGSGNWEATPGDWMVLKNLGSRFDKARRKGICCSKTKPSEPDFGNGLQGSTWNPEGYACVLSTLDAFCQWLPTIDCWSGSVICSQPEPCTDSFHLVQYHRSMNPMMAS